MAKIVVVGAGVVGLTTALELLKLPVKHEVTVVAAQIPGDFDFKSNYTSPFAGANWDSFAAKDDIVQQKIDAVGYKVFKQLAEDRPESGVIKRVNYQFITKDQFAVDGEKKNLPWFAEFPDCNLKLVPYFDHRKFAYAFQFDGFVISTTYYLTFLVNECFRTGRFDLQRKELSSLDEAFYQTPDGTKADIVVNCSGLRARELVPDSEMYPVRGVTILVDNTIGLKEVLMVDAKEASHPNELLYIFPRKEGGLVIGGCFEERHEEKDISEAQVARILARAKEYLPELGWPEQFNIVRRQVGFRPFRESGPRIEADKQVKGLFHCYGHGGAGYQASWGSAEKVVGLVERYLVKRLFSNKF